MAEKILVIAPRPDDDVLGRGGAIKKYSLAGAHVAVCYVTKAYTPDWSEEFIRNRANEIAKANKILGVKESFLLDYPTVKLDTVPQKDLNGSIGKIVDGFGPDIVFLPFNGDLNADHRIVFESSLVALRPYGKKIRKVLCYETLSETEWGSPIRVFVPDVYFDISLSIESKLEAMKAYSSELKQYPHPRSAEVIRANSIKRGSEAGLEFAEAFKLVREVIL